MRILCFGTYERARQPRMEILSEGFDALGDEVIECNEPLELDTALRVGMLKRPWLVPIMGWRMLVAWTRLRRRAKQLPPIDAVIVGYMGHFDVHLAKRLFNRKPIVLDHMISARDTALDRGTSNERLLRVLGGLDRSAVHAATIPMVDTQENLDLLDEKGRARAVVTPVGASRRWFEAHPTSQDDMLRVIFYGSFAPLQGAPVIGEAIGLLANYQALVRFTIVGRGQDLDRTVGAAAGNPQVRWIPWVNQVELPRLVAEHDVCLGIFGATSKALRVVPHKVYEGAAAGCAIVTSDTHPQRRALDGAAVFVSPGDAEGLAEALRTLALDRDQVASLRARARSRAEERFRGAIVVAELRDRLRSLT